MSQSRDVTGRYRRHWPLAVVVVWAIALAAGGMGLVSYAHQPGPVGASPPTWPEDVPLQRVSDRPTLLLFAHPKCPCTQATVADLARMRADCRASLDVVIIVFHPADATSDWADGATLDAALALPDTHVVFDAGARLARRFGAATSGHALLYGVGGSLLFSGGITPGRGDEGLAAGRVAIGHLVSGRPAEHTRLPVFGCPIYDPAQPDANCRVQTP